MPYQNYNVFLYELNFLQGHYHIRVQGAGLPNIQFVGTFAEYL